MKFRHKLLSFFTFAFFSGCYTVNERESLSIVFNDSKLHPDFIKTYIDSVRNKNFIIPDSIKEIFFGGDSIREDESLVYFNNAPKEWYLVLFNSAPGSIERVYNPELSTVPIIRKTDLTEDKIRQIEVRYRKEILDSVILYGKSHHLPDSVVFNTKVEKPPYNK